MIDDRISPFLHSALGVGTVHSTSLSRGMIAIERDDREMAEFKVRS
jgi:hypothetical protein